MKGDITVELHWSLQRHPSLRVDTGALWRRRIPYQREGLTIPVLAPEDELLAQLIAVPVDMQLGKLTLRTLMEIGLMAEGRLGTIDWDAFLSRSRNEGVSRMIRAGLGAVLTLFTPGLDGKPLEAALGGLRVSPATADITRALQNPRGPLSLAQKQRAFALYDAPRAVSWLWWAVSLPPRLLVYRGAR